MEVQGINASVSRLHVYFDTKDTASCTPYIR